MRSKRNLFALILACIAAAQLGVACQGGPGTKPTGDASRGANIFRVVADGSGAKPACASCHCPNATGGCNSFDAPNIQGEDYADISARTRDPNVDHPGGKFSFSDQDIADIEAFLADPNAVPVQ